MPHPGPPPLLRQMDVSESPCRGSSHIVAETGMAGYPDCITGALGNNPFQSGRPGTGVRRNSCSCPLHGTGAISHQTRHALSLWIHQWMLHCTR